MGLLTKSHSRSLVDYLVSHPTAFRATIARMRPELGGLYLAAYQSDIWNRVLAQMLTDTLPPEQLTALPLRLGPVPAPLVKAGELADLKLPLPSARLKLVPGAIYEAALSAVLAEEGYPLSEMKIRGLRQPFFSRGERSAFVWPNDLGGTNAADETHPKRRKLTLTFDLPRGSYATIVIKRLCQIPDEIIGDEAADE